MTGSGFRATQSAGGNTSSILFNGVGAAVTTWSDTQIVATVPASATSGPVTVNAYGATSNGNIVFHPAKSSDHFDHAFNCCESLPRYRLTEAALERPREQ